MCRSDEHENFWPSPCEFRAWTLFRYCNQDQNSLENLTNYLQILNRHIFKVLCHAAMPAEIIWLLDSLASQISTLIINLMLYVSVSSQRWCPNRSTDCRGRGIWNIRLTYELFSHVLHVENEKTQSWTSTDTGRSVVSTRFSGVTWVIVLRMISWFQLCEWKSCSLVFVLTLVTLTFLRFSTTWREATVFQLRRTQNGYTQFL